MADKQFSPFVWILSSKKFWILKKSWQTREAARDFLAFETELRHGGWVEQGFRPAFKKSNKVFRSAKGPRAARALRAHQLRRPKHYCGCADSSVRCFQSGGIACSMITSSHRVTVGVAKRTESA